MVDWTQAQQEDPELEITISWIKADQASSLRTDLSELVNTKDGLALISQQKHLVIINNKLHMRATPPNCLSSQEHIEGEQLMDVIEMLAIKERIIHYHWQQKDSGGQICLQK